MNKEEAIELLDVIAKYVSQQYGQNYYYEKKNIFVLLKKYHHDFPSNCFYSGIVYRKTTNPNLEFGELRSCSKIKGANSHVASLRGGRNYRFECHNGYDLEQIVLFISKNFSIDIPSGYTILFAFDLLERIRDESEVIATVSRKGFKRANRK